MLRLTLGGRLVEESIRGMERACSPKQIKQAPSSLKVTRGVVIAAVENDVPVEAVRNEQDGDRGHHEVKGGRPPPTPDGQANGNRDKNEVHQWIRHSNQFFCRRQSWINGIRRYEENP